MRAGGAPGSERRKAERGAEPGASECDRTRLEAGESSTSIPLRIGEDSTGVEAAGWELLPQADDAGLYPSSRGRLSASIDMFEGSKGRSLAFA